MKIDPAIVRQALAAFLGDEQFRKFVKQGLLRGRLRYWQERKWLAFSAANPDLTVEVSELTVILRICELHGDELLPDTVEACRRPTHYAPNYIQARARLFPHAKTSPAFVEAPFRAERAEVWYCPTCRAAEAVWLEKSPTGSGSEIDDASRGNAEVLFWPWRIGKPEAEWDAFEKDYIGFMQVAFAEGFRPREGPCITVEADAPSGRAISLVRRGRRNGWEPWLTDGDRSCRLGPFYGLPLGEAACVCVRPPFRAAAYFALEWLRGRPLGSLLSDFKFVGGSPAGIVLRDVMLCEWC